MESKIICQGTEISRTWNASLPIPWPRAEDPNKRATVTMSRVTFGHLAHLHILCTYRILGWLVQFCIFKSFQIQPIPASLCLEDMEGYGHVLQKDYNRMLYVSAFKTLLRAWLDWMCVTCHKEAKVGLQMQQIRPVIVIDSQPKPKQKNSDRWHPEIAAWREVLLTGQRNESMIKLLIADS